MSDSPTLDFEHELRSTFLSLRTALLALFDGAGVDPSAPYPASRTLGLDKSLVWKVSKVVGADEPAGAVRHIPGAAGMQKLLEGFREAGASEDSLGAVRRAVDAVQSLVRDHTGDRATLDLMLAGMQAGDALEGSRKQAFRGNSGIWGVQARLRHSCFLLAPNDVAPERVDVALVSGYERFQRLRPGLAWPLMRLRSFGVDTTPSDAPTRVPIEPPGEAAEGQPSFLQAFCTRPLPEMRIDRQGAVDVLVLEPGPVGKKGAADLVFGDVDRALGSVHRDADDDWVEMRVEVTVPVEFLQLDLLVHESIRIAREPRFQVAGHLWGELPPPGDGSDLHGLPTDASVQDLGVGAAAHGSSAFPRGPRILAAAFEHLGWDPRSFRGYRTTLKFPPLHTSGILRFQLCERA